MKPTRSSRISSSELRTVDLLSFVDMMKGGEEFRWNVIFASIRVLTHELTDEIDDDTQSVESDVGSHENRRTEIPG